MHKFLTPLALLIILLPVHAEEPSASLPDAVRQMLAAAIAGGDDAEIMTVAKYAAEAVPDARVQIEAMVAQYHAAQDRAVQERLASTDPFALWQGRAELSGFRSTGSTSEFGVSLGLAAERKSVRWRHALKADIDYRRANGRVSKERIVASYSPRYNFDPRGFVYGLGQYERDPSVGFDGRYTGSAGIGYMLIDTDAIDFSIDAGPSVRHVAYSDGTRETKPGMRSSFDFKWALTPSLSFRQTASGYSEKHVASITSMTALDAKLVSVLTARLSYNVLYETDSHLTDEKLDTLSKLTLIYEF